MRHRHVSALAILIAALAGPAMAQTPPDEAPAAQKPADTTSAAAYLEQAKQAVTAGRIWAAQDLLEHAETRALDRSVRPSQAREPSQQALVQNAAAAREALAKGDRAKALQLIDEAQKSAAAAAE